MSPFCDFWGDPFVVKIVPDVNQSFRNRCFLFFFGGGSLTLGSMFDKLLQGWSWWGKGLIQFRD